MNFFKKQWFWVILVVFKLVIFLCINNFQLRNKHELQSFLKPKAALLYSLYDATEGSFLRALHAPQNINFQALALPRFCCSQMSSEFLFDCCSQP